MLKTPSPVKGDESICTTCIKFGPKFSFSKTAKRKGHSKPSNAFSVSNERVTSGVLISLVQ